MASINAPERALLIVSALVGSSIAPVAVRAAPLEPPPTIAVSVDELAPSPDRDARLDRDLRFVGAAACAQCHPDEYRLWAETAHASAFETLAADGRSDDPNCVGCHVTGFGHPTGYRSSGVGDPLAGVQCESCHGPGSVHTRLPASDTIRRQVDDTVCERCHDREHSSGFFADRGTYRLHGWHEPKETGGETAALLGRGIETDVRVPTVDLFVMSLCPFGTAAERELIALRRQLEGQFDLRVRYIVRREGEAPISSRSAEPGADRCADDGTSAGPAHRGFESLHGEEEVEENLRQLAIAQLDGERFLDYLERRAADVDADWRLIARDLELDVSAVEAAVPDMVERLDADAGVARELGINASPTMFVDGALVEFGVAGLVRRLCSELDAPELCDALPVCLNDADCGGADLEGRCVEPGTATARCETRSAPEVTLHVLNDPACGLCSPALIVRPIMERFSRLVVRGHDVTRGEGRRWVDAFGLAAVPAFVLEGVETSLHFEAFNAVLESGGGGHRLDPASFGLGPLYFERPTIDGAVDLWVFATGSLTQAMVDAVAEPLSQTRASVRIRHLVEERRQESGETRIVARGDTAYIVPESSISQLASSLGQADLDEAKRQACVAQLYGEPRLLEYLVDRADSTEAGPGDWRARATQLDMDPVQIGFCAGSGGAFDRLSGDRVLADSLSVVRPAILVDNRLRFDGLGPWNSGAFRRALAGSALD